jgi:pimeloyl-ACP methyl ester carboxylesterase
MVRIVPPFLLLVTLSALGQPVGRRIDIGGRSLHIVCMGQGAHTVVMESGVATAFYEWWLVQTALQKELRTCSYDRAGFGWSDPTPSRSVAGYIDDLHELLRRSGEKPPFILVGHSMGGPFVERYYWRYPSEVAGMILVDPANVEAGFTSTPEYKQAAAAYRAKRTKEMDEWRAKNNWPKQTFPAELPADLRTRLAASSASRNWWEARFAEGALPDLEVSMTPEQRKIRVPLVIVEAKWRNPSGWSDEVTERFRKHMREEQSEIASRSPDTKIVEVDTGHDVPMEAPDVVANEIRQMAHRVW